MKKFLLAVLVGVGFTVYGAQNKALPAGTYVATHDSELELIIRADKTAKMTSAWSPIQGLWKPFIFDKPLALNRDGSYSATGFVEFKVRYERVWGDCQFDVEITVVPQDDGSLNVDVEAPGDFRTYPPVARRRPYCSLLGHESKSYHFEPRFRVKD